MNILQLCFPPLCSYLPAKWWNFRQRYTSTDTLFPFANLSCIQLHVYKRKKFNFLCWRTCYRIFLKEGIHTCTRVCIYIINFNIKYSLILIIVLFIIFLGRGCGVTVWPLFSITSVMVLKFWTCGWLSCFARHFYYDSVLRLELRNLTRSRLTYKMLINFPIRGIVLSSRRGSRRSGWFSLLWADGAAVTTFRIILATEYNSFLLPSPSSCIRKGVMDIRWLSFVYESWGCTFNLFIF